MIVNPVFSKSGKGLNPLAGKCQDARQKARQITRVYNLMNDNFRWSKSSKKYFDFYIIEHSAIFK